MANQKLLNMIGLAKRAGKVITGEELVTKAIQQGRCQLVFVAKDASTNLIKKINDKTQFYNIKSSQEFSTSELSAAIGTDRKVLAITDAGFAKKMETLFMND